MVALIQKQRIDTILCIKKDCSILYEKYKGMWVALAEDEMTVLGVGKTVKEAIAKAKKKSTQTPYLTLVPKTLDAFVGVL